MQAIMLDESLIQDLIQSSGQQYCYKCVECSVNFLDLILQVHNISPQGTLNLRTIDHSSVSGGMVGCILWSFFIFVTIEIHSNGTHEITLSIEEIPCPQTLQWCCCRMPHSTNPCIVNSEFSFNRLISYSFQRALQDDFMAQFHNTLNCSFMAHS